MSKETIGVDDLLARQNELRPSIRATVKVGEEGRVTVTPVVGGGGCACEQSITVSKAEIEGVVPTDDFHDCCGERFIVVEVAFASETVADIFRQLGEAAGPSSQGAPANASGPFAQPSRPLVPWLRQESDWGAKCSQNRDDCLQSCYWGSRSPIDQARCIQRCWDIYRQCTIAAPWHQGAPIGASNW
jgi:hypothetical protein